MTVLHLRDLAQYGLIPDVDPYNLPSSAFSGGMNVRFDDGSVERAVVFRGVDTTNGASRPVLLNLSASGSAIGDLTGGGNLAASFDTTTSTALASCSSKAAATSGYVGRSPAAAKKVYKVIVYGSNDQGFVNTINSNVTLTLYGKTGAAPANATDGTSLGTLTFADTANESAGRTITSSNKTTAYDHIWVKVAHDGAANTIAVAELAVYEAVYPSSPRAIFTWVGPSDSEELAICYKNGTVSEWVVGGSETDISPTAYTASDSEALFTSCQLGGVLYINRNDRVPWDFKPTDTIFETLANWNVNWRCNILRSYNDALIALNVTESGTSYPTKVRTSDIASYGTVPTTWDETDPTNNATANVLAEMRGDIVDGLALGSSFIIYTNQESWLMQADGSDNVYSYRRLFNDAGAMSANCSVEVDGKHYVFGYKDIWVHDGVGKKSLCDAKTRKQIFTNLDFRTSFLCFVLHNPVLSEIYFCYRDGAADTEYFDSVVANNVAAVYSYKNDTWSFISLPNIYGGDNMVVSNSLVTYDTITGTYDDTSTSYFNLTEDSKRVPIMVGNADTTFSLSDKLYALDLDGAQSLLSFTVDTNATKNWFLERDGVDLDELNLDLRGYKHIVSVYPQARLPDDSQTIEFAFGSADTFGVTPTYTDFMTYDNTANYKLDYKSGGRYLSYKLRGTSGGLKTFRLSGVDFDVEITGDR